MNELKFIQLQKDSRELFDMAQEVWLPFIHEVNANDGITQTDNEVISGLQNRINIQGTRKDMHFEIALLKDEVIGISMFAVDLGTIYGLLDHPRYGTVMGFYIKPMHRRKGFGRIFFKHIQAILRRDGADKMYICPDSVTGIPFWSAMGFSDSGKFDPDDKKPIYIKEITDDGISNPTLSIPHRKQCSKIVKIQISKYLTNALAEKIAAAQWHCVAPEWINGIRRATYENSYFYDCFEVIATDQNNNVVGRLHCIQNEHDKSLWYYGDLFVIHEYRRIGIATQMIQSAINHLCELNAKTLRVYVSPDNAPSIALQKSVGFIEKPYQVFNNLINDGDMMFELGLPYPYSAIPASSEEAVFVMIFYQQNIEILHGKFKSLDEWKTILSPDDDDEKNFLICRGCMPLAWLRINGLLNKDMAWISMLAVSDMHHRQGIGSYAIEFSEKFVRQKGFRKVGIHTTDDNIPAQNLYKKCGYTVTEYGECTTGDGVRRMGYTFEKEISV